MGILDIMSRVVGIFGGIVTGLSGLITLIEKCKPYIKRQKAETEKDPSACLPASDGSSGDCESNR